MDASRRLDRVRLQLPAAGVGAQQRRRGARQSWVVLQCAAEYRVANSFDRWGPIRAQQRVRRDRQRTWRSQYFAVWRNHLAVERGAWNHGAEPARELRAIAVLLWQPQPQTRDDHNLRSRSSAGMVAAPAARRGVRISQFISQLDRVRVRHLAECGS